jgi:WD40 repeat protein
LQRRQAAGSRTFVAVEATESFRRRRIWAAMNLLRNPAPIVFAAVAAAALLLASETRADESRAPLPERPRLVFKSGHSTSLAAAAFSPDGKLVASAGNDKKILVWEVASGKLRQVLYGHDQVPDALVFGPFNKILISGDADGKIFQWNVVTGRRKDLRSASRAAAITALAISPNGRWLAFGNDRGELYLLDLRRPEGRASPLSPVCRSPVPVGAQGGRPSMPAPCEALKLVFSRDSTLVASSHPLGTVNLFRVATRENLFSRKVPGHVYASGGTRESGAEIVFAGDNRLYSAGDDLGHLSVFDVTAGVEVFKLLRYSPVAAAFSQDAEQLAVANDPTLRDIRVWAVPSFQERRPIHSEKPLALPLVAGSDKSLLAAVGSDGLQILHTNGPSLMTQSGPISPVRMVSFSTDGNRMATAGSDARLRIWDLIQGKLEHSFAVDFMAGATLSANGNRVAYFDTKEHLRVYDLTTRDSVVTRFSHPFSASPKVALSPDGQWVAWSGQTLRLWKVGSDAKPTVLCPGTADAFAFSPDGERIAAVCTLDDKAALLLWRVAAPNEVQTLGTPGVESKGLLFTRDGKVTLRADDRILVFDPVSGQPRTLIRAATDESFTAFAFGGLHDEILITAGVDRTGFNTTVWKSPAGTVVRRLRSHASAVFAVAASANGRRVASGDDDGATLIWDAANGNELGAVISVHPFQSESDQWIVITRTGLFDGSADAMKWVGWVEPRSDAFYPLDCFFEGFYSPGLLSDLFGLHPPEAVFGIAEQLRIPAFHALFAEGLISIRQRGKQVFLCMAEVPNTAVLNGIELRAAGDRVLLEPANFSRNDESGECAFEHLLSFPLADIELAARSITRRKSVTTPWDGASADFRAERSSHSTLHVQVFGINQYAAVSGYSTLRYARPDAVAVEDFFELHARSIYSQVRVWPGLYDSEATLEGIRDRLQRLAGEVRPDDVVVLFLSGHGVVPSGQEMFYFVPSDMGARGGNQIDREREGGFNTAMIAEALRNLPARRIIVIIDACQSGGALDSLVHVAEIKLAIEERLLRDTAAKSSGPAGVYILAAATPFRAAIAAYGHGLLTQALLDVLSGCESPSGGASSSENVSARDLLDRLSSAMQRLSVEKNLEYEQKPLKFGLGADIPLVGREAAGPHEAR